MKNIVWIATCAPYDQIRHAGGQNFNYYLKYFQKLGKFHITVTGVDYIQNKKNVTLEQKGIRDTVYYRDYSKKDYLLRRVCGAFSMLNIWSQYDRLLLCYERWQIFKNLKKYKREKGAPDIVILHWTAIALLLAKVKKIFRDSKIVIIEEDVTYLNYLRQYEIETRFLSKKMRYFFYTHLKKDELQVIQDADLTVTVNQKDYDLLVNDGISEKKMFLASPYFHDYANVCNQSDGRTVLFFGAMSRPENYDAAIWFIDFVMPLTANKICLEIVGANPPQKLLNKACENVIIRGYVEDITPFLEKSICMVVPLFIGAGIKIKILEGMSAGVTILTNDIGIEGIPAIDQKEYIHCDTAKEYAKHIMALQENPQLCKQYGEASRKLIQGHFHVKKKLDQLCEKL